MTHMETHDTAAGVAAPGAPAAPPPAPAKHGASQKTRTPRGLKTAAGAKTKAAPKKKSKAKAKVVRAKQVPTPRAESKGAQILALIRRSKGATLAEMQKITGWQPHSVRGYLSSAAKKHNLRIESTKNEEGDRVYHVQS